LFITYFLIVILLLVIVLVTEFIDTLGEVSMPEDILGEVLVESGVTLSLVYYY
jgi:hypothetical protein